MFRNLLIMVAFILFLPLVGYSQLNQYKVKKICRGGGKTAAVVEYNKNHYVITSTDYLSRKFKIIYISSIEFGGPARMDYVDNNIRETITINVLDRMRYKYSGYVGARAICRDVVTRGRF